MERADLTPVHYCCLRFPRGIDCRVSVDRAERVHSGVERFYPPQSTFNYLYGRDCPFPDQLREFDHRRIERIIPA
jgi:hypothetical protein